MLRIRVKVRVRVRVRVRVDTDVLKLPVHDIAQAVCERANGKDCRVGHHLDLDQHHHYEGVERDTEDVHQGRPAFFRNVPGDVISVAEFMVSGRPAFFRNVPGVVCEGQGQGALGLGRAEGEGERQAQGSGEGESEGEGYIR
jgi:hypothetical protein